MTQSDFNNKYKNIGLNVEVLKTVNQYTLFNKEFTLGFDYRVLPADSIDTHVSSFTSGFSCNKDLTTSLTYLLYQNGSPAGLATLIIEPKDSFSRMRGLKRLDGKDFSVCLLTEALDIVPDFAVIRGWRVLISGLRNKGIGFDLRELITHEITTLVKNFSTTSFGYWGMVQGTLNSTEKKIISEQVYSHDVGTIIPPEQIGVDTRLLGLPNHGSIPAMIGYIKDGFQYKKTFTFPNSFGAFFIKPL